MKTKILFFFFFFFLYFVGGSAAWTVDNNPNSPAQYSDLQLAIDNAAIGDTILVAGSATSYGNITIDRQLTIIGAGYHNQYGDISDINHLYFIRQNASSSADGSKIMGFDIYYIEINGWFSGGTIANQGISNVIIERCYFKYVNFNDSYCKYSKDTIRNCIINSYYIDFNNVNSSEYDSIFIHNNIFDGSYISQNDVNYGLENVFIRNNVFINRTNYAFYNINSAVIENNIFYASEPHGTSGCTNSVFNNNITYYCSDNTIPYGTNTGANNFVNSDPKFENYPIAGGEFDYSYDFHLKTGSPGLNAGTDVTNIGIYGGSLPFEVGANPTIPQVTEINFIDGVSSAPIGGTINVNFKAKKQD